MSSPFDDAMTREPMFEDLFYPADKSELYSKVSDMLSRNQAGRSSDLALSPCASLDYAGDLMARAIASFAGLAPQRLIMVASAESDWDSSGPCLWLPESASFRTPLYESLVDTDFCATLKDMSTLFRVNDVPHLETYRIEIQLPFVHVLYPQASIVPILVSGRSESLVRALIGGLHMSALEHPASQAILICGNVSGYRPSADASREAERIIQSLTRGDSTALLTDPDIRTDSVNVLAVFAALTRQRPVQVLGQKSSTPGNKSLVSLAESIEYAALAAG